MKNLMVVMMVLLSGVVTAQDDDRAGVKEAVIGYIQNFFSNDYDAMEVHLHERLSKRGINQDGSLSEDYSKEDLKSLMDNKQPLALKSQKNEIVGLKIDRRFAKVVLATGYPKTRWKEYIHLAKIGDRWMVMDVFWNFD